MWLAKAEACLHPTHPGSTGVGPSQCAAICVLEANTESRNSGSLRPTRESSGFSENRTGMSASRRDKYCVSVSRCNIYGDHRIKGTKCPQDRAQKKRHHRRRRGQANVTLQADIVSDDRAFQLHHLGCDLLCAGLNTRTRGPVMPLSTDQFCTPERGGKWGTEAVGATVKERWYRAFIMHETHAQRADCAQPRVSLSGLSVDVLTRPAEVLVRCCQIVPITWIIYDSLYGVSMQTAKSPAGSVINRSSVQPLRWAIAVILSLVYLWLLSVWMVSPAAMLNATPSTKNV